MNQTTMNPFWMKCDNNAWCSLEHVDLSHKYYDNFLGVYVIWYWDNFGNPVLVVPPFRVNPPLNRIDRQARPY